MARVLCEGFTVSIDLVKNKLLSEFEFFFINKKKKWTCVGDVGNYI